MQKILRIVFLFLVIIFFGSTYKYYSSNKNIKNNGFVLFTHRIDLWHQQDFLSILKKHQKSLKISKISRPVNYLPLNNDFKNKIKIKIVLLQKY